MTADLDVDVAVVGEQAEKSVAHLLLGMRGHKSALALTAHQQVFCGQFVDRFAHGALANLETAGQIDFAWNSRAGLPLAGLQALQHQHLDLLVERAEGGGRVRDNRNAIGAPGFGQDAQNLQAFAGLQEGFARLA